MNQLKDAARLGLEALSNASWHLPEGKDIDQQCEKAINALRAALALPDAEPVKLTDAKVKLLWDDCIRSNAGYKDFARAIAAAIQPKKEKTK